MTKNLDDKVEEGEDKSISEKEFFKILLESEENLTQKINKYNSSIVSYHALINKSLFYKSIGYNIKYYLTTSGILYLKPHYYTPGFK